MSLTFEIVIWIITLILSFKIGIWCVNAELRRDNKYFRDALRQSEKKVQLFVSSKKEILLKDLEPDGYCIYSAFVYKAPSPNGSCHSSWEPQWNRKIYFTKDVAKEAKDSIEKIHNSWGINRWIYKIVPVYILNSEQ